MLSNKPIVRNLVEICAAKGIDYVVISPGSRNAPLIISFNEHGHFNCLSIPDERVAGYFAMGIAQQTRKPVIITCTSGTASLNFAPAIAEAFYQKIPLLIITADRPVEWIHQGEGQSINQREVFSNYVLKSYQLPQEPTHKDELWSANRMVAEAIDTCYTKGGGPVHLNIPFREPLYDKKDYKEIPLPKIINSERPLKSLSATSSDALKKEWGSANKKMILCGLLPKHREDYDLKKNIEELVDKTSTLILSETNSNLINTHQYISHIDGVLSLISEEEIIDFQPDLLVTIGGSFISKKLKQFFRKHQPTFHWHIGEEEYFLDTFQSVTKYISMSVERFFFEFALHFTSADMVSETTAYKERWLEKHFVIQAHHRQFLAKTEWSDLKAFEIILDYLPGRINLHMGNSTPVRYIQLFPPNPTIHYNSNRVIMNNGGGNIFRYIPGPPTTNQLDTYFETKHNLNAEHIAKTFNIVYYFAEEEAMLKEHLSNFLKPQPNNRPAILEIKTDGNQSAEIFRSYYKRMM